MGPVTVRAADGRDMTPRGRKACGALAALAMAPGMRLARARLQDLLWSQSPPERGNASLRQMLRELRGALGDEALCSGDGWVGLAPSQVAVDLAPRKGAAGQPAEFAEGLDVADPEFDDWLRDTRLAIEDMPPPGAGHDAPPALVLALAEPQGGTPTARMIATMVIQQAARRAGQLIPAQVVPAPAPATGAGLVAETLCIAQDGGGLALMVVLRDLAGGAQLWAQHYPVSSAEADLRRAAGAVALTMIQTAGQMRGAGARLYPVQDVFSFDPRRLSHADTRLAAAGEPVADALRGFLRYTMIIERATPDPADTLAEAAEIVAHARAAAPGEPIVLAAAALTQSWAGDVAGALDLARLACHLAPGHDMAQLALSQALNDAGRDGAALDATQQGGGPISLLGRSAWQARRAAVLIRLNRLDEAEACANAALAHAPDCRPALRFLAALRWRRGDEAGAAQALAALRRAEPDFSLDLMGAPDYPVSTLRRAGLMGVARSGL